MINYFDDEALQELINQIKTRDQNVKDFAGDLTGKTNAEGVAYTSVQAYLEDLIAAGAGSSGDGVDSSIIGELSSLTTEAKTNLVAAINEIDANVDAIVIPDTSDFLTSANFNAITSARILDMFSGESGSSSTLVELTLGETYSLGGYNWTCAEEIDGGYVLQSQGVICGSWPGYKMTKFGNGSFYRSNIDGQDISDYDTKMQSLYNLIQSAEKTGVSYGLGLFLISNAKVGTTTAGQGSGYYRTALKTAATNYTSFGADNYRAWLGTVYGSDCAWCVNQDDTVDGFYQINTYVVAPTFNIDASKITLDGNTINIK